MPWYGRGANRVLGKIDRRDDQRAGLRHSPGVHIAPCRPSYPGPDRLASWWVLVVVLLVARTAHAEAEPPTDRYTLTNGLEVVLQPDRRLPLVAVNLTYHVGTMDSGVAVAIARVHKSTASALRAWTCSSHSPGRRDQISAIPRRPIPRRRYSGSTKNSACAATRDLPQQRRGADVVRSTGNHGRGDAARVGRRAPVEPQPSRGRIAATNASKSPRCSSTTLRTIDGSTAV